jgi:hypothetical protein
MSYEVDIFDSLDSDFLKWLIENRYQQVNEKYSKFWNYYQNISMSPNAAGFPAAKMNDLSRNYIQAQEIGLPSRITGVTTFTPGTLQPDISQRKEIVIENDIAWRVNAMVDYLFGKGLTICSRAVDSRKREQIDMIIKNVFAAAGGMEFFQNMAVLGSVYGFVDCILRPEALFIQPAKNTGFEAAMKAAESIEIDLVEATHSLAVLKEDNYKRIEFYVQHFPQSCNSVNEKNSFLSRLFNNPSSTQRKICYITEIISENARAIYRDGELIEKSVNPLGVMPVVHIQNIAQPCYYEGLSDVEPLIPLQDELNTRLSDRANRITMQSFKMYLAKGIELATEREVMPGRMWCTDNDQAEVCEFGGDAAAPGEDAHIQEVREALDKVSGVTPVAAGVIRGKLGNLTSAVALKMTLMGTLAKTERKRLTYGEGIKQLCRLILKAFDSAGIYRTSPVEREFEIRFPNPMPEDTIDKLNEAKMKIELGVEKNKVLEELGY